MIDPNVFGAGVVTLANWTMMADGSAYMHVWADKWHVVTNEGSGIKGLRTTDKYHLVAYSADGKAAVIIPGCQVKGYAACEKNPSLRGGSQVYTVGG
jgi:hypothetical protein